MSCLHGHNFGLYHICIDLGLTWLTPIISILALTSSLLREKYLHHPYFASLYGKCRIYIGTIKGHMTLAPPSTTIFAPVI